MMGETISITSIDYPPDGIGIFTYLDHYKYPYKGYPDEKVVEKNAIMKRCVLATIKRATKFPFVLFAPLFLISPPFIKRKVFEIFIWEFDNSYRFRGQDVFSELNKEALRENPRKEIVRLFKLGLSRERAGLSEKDKEALRAEGAEFFDTNAKWKLLIRVLSVALLFSKDLLSVCTRFFEELDPLKMKPDEGDWYWMCERCE